MSIGKRLIILITSFIILTLFLTLSSYHIARKNIIQKVEDMGHTIVHEVALTFEEYFIKLYSTVEAVSRIISYLHYKNIEYDYSDLLHQYYDVLKYQGVQTLFIGMEDGSFYEAKYWIPPHGYTPLIRPWYRDAVDNNKTIITKPYIDAITHDLVISISTPIHHFNNIIGVIGLDTNMYHITNKVSSKLLLPNTISFIIDNEGNFVSSSNKDWSLSQNIAQESEYISTDLAIIGQEIIATRKGFTSIVLDNESMLLFYHSINDALIFGFFLPKYSFYLLARQISALHIVGGIILIFFIIFLLVPTILNLNTTFSKLIIVLDEMSIKLKQNFDLSETAFNVQQLAKEIEVIQKETNIYEIGLFLESIVSSLYTISNQNEEISALTEETIAMQNDLCYMNEELNKRQTIWKNTLEVMNKLTTTSKTNKFKEVTNTILQTTNAFGVLIARIQGDYFKNISYAGYDATSEFYIKKALVSKSLAGEACRQNIPLWIEDVSQYEYYIMIHPNVVTEVEIPLSHNGKYNGILEIAFDKYTKRNEELLETLVPVASALGSFLEVDLAHYEIKESYKYLVQKLQSVTEIWHLESADHMDRIGAYVKLLAKLLDKTKEEQKDIDVFSRLHDIGKLKIPIEILSKPTSLTADEIEIIHTHPLYGAELIGGAKWLDMARTICLTHHEKWDGSGYPLGLKENQIPWEGQITALADVYDALRSRRVYKKETLHEETVRIILEGDGRTQPEHFNPLLLKLFKEHHQQFNIIYEQSMTRVKDRLK